jgi:hypothetical protein
MFRCTFTPKYPFVIPCTKCKGEEGAGDVGEDVEGIEGAAILWDVSGNPSQNSTPVQPSVE